MKQLLTFRSWGFGTFESWIGDDFHFAKLGVINFQKLQNSCPWVWEVGLGTHWVSVLWRGSDSRGQMPCSVRENPSVEVCSRQVNFKKLNFLLREVDCQLLEVGFLTCES